MAKVFATRVWGFNPAVWPMVTFNKEGIRDNLLRRSDPGDYIVFVGTQDEPTAEEDRGRLLGIALLSRIPKRLLEVVAYEDLPPYELDADGNPRHATGILMARAWMIRGRPFLIDVIPQLPYEATPSAHLLDPDEADAILGLQFDEVRLPDIAAITQQRNMLDGLMPAGPTRGPKPTNWSRVVSHDASVAGWVYVMRFGSTNIWKIGHAVDVADRLADVNKHVPSELLGYGWKCILRQRYPTQEQAWEVEQRTLRALDKFRTIGERVRCDENTITDAWTSAFVG
jgi:hypothetical protein